MSTQDKILDPMLPSPYEVTKVTKDTKDTFTMELFPKDSDEKFHFKPGQFNMLYIFGAGEVPMSICGDPTSSQPLKHTTRIVGNVTRLMGGLKSGDLVGVRGPFGSHWPLEEAENKDVIIVAGGIGLAPLRPVIYQILHERDKYKNVIVMYGTRTPEDILYENELQQWEQESKINVYVTVDRAAGDWKGNVGVVTSLIPRATFDPSQTKVYICGPEVMMSFTIRALKQRGLNDEDIYVSMERNMKCAVGFCGHCQYGPHFICKDGPVFRYDRIEPIFRIEEI